MSILKRVLVTGSSGFIGSALCRQLDQMKEIYQVYTLNRSGDGQNHIRADITIDNLTSKLIDINPEVIVHLAGNVSVPFSVEFPLEDFNVNARGTLALLLAAKKTDCKNFVYVTSGGAIYDSSATIPFKESAPINPVSPYGLSKYVGEGYVRVLSEARGSEWSSLAISNVYGSVKIQKQGVVYRFWNDIQNGISPTVFGASVSRDFIHIDDVVCALIKVIEQPVNCRINISSNTSTKLIDLLGKIINIMGSDTRPTIEGAKFGDVIVSQLDNSKAKDLVSWYPQVDLINGLERSLLKK